jgi:hypothetical protein
MPVESWIDYLFGPEPQRLFMDRTVLDRAEQLQRRIYQLRDSL